MRNTYHSAAEDECRYMGRFKVKMQEFKIKYLISSVLCFLLFGGYSALKAQSVMVEASLDSFQIYIGQQTKLRLQVSTEVGKSIVFPNYQDTLVNGVEVIGVPTIDSLLLNDDKVRQLTATYTITSFDSALYSLPPMQVFVDGKPFLSKALVLKVYTVPVDVSKPEVFAPLRDVMKPAFAWDDWIPFIWLSLLVVVLLSLSIYLILRYRDNKPIIRMMRSIPKLPPHQQALKEINRIKKEEPWKDNREKEYYTRLTETLRFYIRERFGFNAMEMTSSEIIDKLSAEADTKEKLTELKSLFQTADLVKFAKWKPEMNDNDYNLLCAIEFVNETKLIAPIAPTPEAVAVTIERKRSRRTRILLLVSITSCILIALACLVYTLLEVYKLFI